MSQETRERLQFTALAGACGLGLGGVAGWLVGCTMWAWGGVEFGWHVAGRLAQFGWIGAAIGGVACLVIGVIDEWFEVYPDA